MPPSFQRGLLFLYLHGTTVPTVRLTVALLLARLGSGVVAIVAALSVITVPDGAVTFTVNRTVHVVLARLQWGRVGVVFWPKLAIS
jgi:hypothetical protein